MRKQTLVSEIANVSILYVITCYAYLQHNLLKQLVNVSYSFDFVFCSYFDELFQVLIFMQSPEVFKNCKNFVVNS